MTLPKHWDIMQPVLELLADGAARKSKDFELPMARHFGLSDEELTRMYDSGNGPVFYDRIGWALSYLAMAEVVDRPRRGVYQINDAGRKLLQAPNKVRDKVEAELALRDHRKRQKSEKVVEETSTLTPQERLYESFEKIRQSTYDAILDTILSKSPTAFEKLVVQLLQKMGYGGEIKDSGEVTPPAGDGGIDGVIKEDILGLGRLHIQAKRYARNRTVGREEIQKFVGALAVAQSNKGVFITTSRYSNEALEYARSLHSTSTVALIDGEDLARYIYDFNLGMQPEQVIEIKKMDADFWDALQDDPEASGG